MKKKALATLLFSVSLILALVSAGGCAPIETDTAEQSCYRFDERARFRADLQYLRWD